ncbi:hypothetical protein AAL_04615 [Moelleriella libera RCEF 2490]|uniref:Uncharacterized protein n=1 Tax=Moelleriella libera RCEF 2490 TaxID=1081109 RepID=A0A168BJD5_9HYPO|nr:hypothetical protein AAL_04615 [Moelleriella libera RCEF 2490]
MNIGITFYKGKYTDRSSSSAVSAIAGELTKSPDGKANAQDWWCLRLVPADRSGTMTSSAEHQAAIV